MIIMSAESCHLPLFRVFGFAPALSLKPTTQTRPRATPFGHASRDSYSFTTVMNIPANDAFSLNSRSHRRRSVTRSPPPKIAFFSPPPVQPRHGARKHSMTLRHRPHSNGSVSHVDGYINGDARHALQEKAAVRRDDETVKGHTSQKIDWEIPRKALHSSIGEYVFRPRFRQC